MTTTVTTDDLDRKTAGFRRRREQRADAIVGHGALMRRQASMLAQTHSPRAGTAAAQRAKDLGMMLMARAAIL